jgi:hypothetical protein
VAYTSLNTRVEHSKGICIDLCCVLDKLEAIWFEVVVTTIYRCCVGFCVDHSFKPNKSNQMSLSFSGALDSSTTAQSQQSNNNNHHDSKQQLELSGVIGFNGELRRFIQCRQRPTSSIAMDLDIYSEAVY